MCIRWESLCQKGKHVLEGKPCVRRGNVYEMGKHESEGSENVNEKGKRVSPEHSLYILL